MFENIDADYQMLINSGEYEPSSRPKKAIFRCVMSLYFSPFFIDHAVFYHNEQKGVSL